MSVKANERYQSNMRVAADKSAARILGEIQIILLVPLIFAVLGELWLRAAGIH
jgi:hypothetical protein